MFTANDTLKALRANGESQSFAEDGTEWRSVYLDNARLPELSPIKFRSHLSQLAKRGLYEAIDGYAWGDVRMTD